GSPALALILGVLLIHGINPGPTLVSERPELFWGLVVSFWIGNVLLLILNIQMLGIWVRLLSVPYHLLYPAILFFVCIGVYSVNLAAYDIWMVIAFSLVGYAMRLLGLPAAPLVLGFVLGPMMEIQFRRTLIFSGGDFIAFVDRPLSATMLGFCALILLWTVASAMRRRRRLALPAGGAE